MRTSLKKMPTSLSLQMTKKRRTKKRRTRNKIENDAQGSNLPCASFSILFLVLRFFVLRFFVICRLRLVGIFFREVLISNYFLNARSFGNAIGFLQGFFLNYRCSEIIFCIFPIRLCGFWGFNDLFGFRLGRNLFIFGLFIFDFFVCDLFVGLFGFFGVLFFSLWLVCLFGFFGVLFFSLWLVCLFGFLSVLLFCLGLIVLGLFRRCLFFRLGFWCFFFALLDFRFRFGGGLVYGFDFLGSIFAFRRFRKHGLSGVGSTFFVDLFFRFSGVG